MEPGHARLRLTPVRRTVAFLALLALLAIGVPATAQEGPVRLSAIAGIGGWVDGTSPTRIEVQVSADVLVVGFLEARLPTSAVRQPIEIPAGATKTYDVTVPPMSGAVSVDVRVLPADGDVPLVSTKVKLRVPDRELLVGVIGSEPLARSISSVQPLITPDPIVAVPISVAALDTSLQPLGYLVSPTPLSSTPYLRDWLEGGGRLVVEDGSRLEIPTTPGGSLAGADVARVGDGEIITVPRLDLVSQTQWSTILRPVPVYLGGVPEYMQPDPALVQAATSAGDGRLPTLPWLLAAIAGFALLVGPVNFLVLGKLGKKELAWLTIPVVSLVSLGGFWVAGRSNLETVITSHASVVILGDEGATARTAFVVVSGTPSRQTVDFDTDWTIYPANVQGFMGGVFPMMEGRGFGMEFEDVAMEKLAMADIGPMPAPELAGPVAAQVDLVGSRLTLDLPRLAAGGVHAAWNPVNGVPTVVAEQTGGSIEASLTAGGVTSFFAWGIASGSQVRLAGSLAANQTAGSSINVGRAGGFVTTDVAGNIINQAEMWNDPASNRFYSLEQAAKSLAPEIVRGSFVFAFSNDFAIPVTLNGRQRNVGGTTMFVYPIDTVISGSAEASLVGVEGGFGVESQPGAQFVTSSGLTSRYLLPSDLQVSPRLRWDAGFGDLPKVFEVFDWTSGTFVATEINGQLDLNRHLSAGGEVFLRMGSGDAVATLYLSPQALTLVWG